jgi:hypothetical protein
MTTLDPGVVVTFHAHAQCSSIASNIAMGNTRAEMEKNVRNALAAHGACTSVTLDLVHHDFVADVASMVITYAPTSGEDTSTTGGYILYGLNYSGSSNSSNDACWSIYVPLFSIDSLSAYGAAQVVDDSTIVQGAVTETPDLGVGALTNFASELATVRSASNEAGSTPLADSINSWSIPWYVWGGLGLGVVLLTLAVVSNFEGKTADLVRLTK